MTGGSGMPRVEDIYYKPKVLPRETWHAGKTFCRVNEEYNTFEYCPNKPEAN